jgi:hypothetical protein
MTIAIKNAVSAKTDRRASALNARPPALWPFRALFALLRR